MCAHLVAQGVAGPIRIALPGLGGSRSRYATPASYSLQGLFGNCAAQQHAAAHAVVPAQGGQGGRRAGDHSLRMRLVHGLDPNAADYAPMLVTYAQVLVDLGRGYRTGGTQHAHSRYSKMASSSKGINPEKKEVVLCSQGLDLHLEKP